MLKSYSTPYNNLNLTVDPSGGRGWFGTLANTNVVGLEQVLVGEGKKLLSPPHVVGPGAMFSQLGRRPTSGGGGKSRQTGGGGGNGSWGGGCRYDIGGGEGAGRIQIKNAARHGCWLEMVLSVPNRRSVAPGG